MARKSALRVLAAIILSCGSLLFAQTSSPNIDNVTPAVGPVGSSVTISGSGFGATQDTSTVSFNGTIASPTAWSDASIVTPVPPGASSGSVVVAVGGSPSNGFGFTVLPTPSITTLNPPSGPVGSSITITGTNFGATQGTSTVTFNGTSASPTTWSDTSIVVPVPTAATTGPIVVTVNGVPSNGASFTVLPTPSITNLNPFSAPVGTSITITGTNFGATQDTSTVTFNATSASPTTWSNTSIVAPVPNGATSGPVVVTVNGVPSNGASFTVLPIPSITNMSPVSGPAGTSVSITGTNFGTTQGGSRVTFNGTNAPITSWNATTIVASVPAGATTGPVVVTVSGVPSNGVAFTVLPNPPVIFALSPLVGPTASTVTITGMNFGATQDTSVVTFNGVSATPNTWSATQIVVPVPVGATTGSVVVTVGTQPSNGMNFTVGQNSGSAPTITALSPSGGLPGNGISISGTNFGSTQGTSSVSFNGTLASPTFWSNTLIVTPVPVGTTSGNVVVNVGGQDSNGVTFTVAAVPNISSMTTAAPIGGSVSISGSNFGTAQGASTVSFNGTLAAVTSWSNTFIGTTVPVGTTSGKVVVTINGQPSNGVTFTVAPAISSISPTLGVIATPVTISGNNFGATQGSGRVTFNGTVATPTTWSDSSILVNVPSSATTGSVFVTANGASSNGVLFTVGSPASITSVLPSSAPVGASVNITGNNFGSFQQTGSTVTFNGVTATVTSWTNTALGVRVPATTSGPVVVTVGGVASNPADFTVTPGPGLSTLSPTSGGFGTSVFISGRNFGSTQGTSTVSFNGTLAAPTSWSSTSISVPVPNGATTGNVVVNVGGIDSNGISFAVNPSPTISFLSPSSGTTNSQVTITGFSFGATQGASTVTFGGNPITPTSWNNTSIVFVVPDGATTASVVVNVGGVSSNAVTYTVVPHISTVTPIMGLVGTSVTVTGTSFGATQGTSTISFNGKTATGNPWSDTSIVAAVPTAATTGSLFVTVNGRSSNSILFTVGSPANLSAIQPVSGPVGLLVTITGSNFGATRQSGSNVTFNGTTASITSWSDSSIVAPVPPGATTGNVVVTVGGTSSNPATFTVTPGPGLTSVSPTSGAAGTTVTVRGNGFGVTQGTNTLTFNGVAATPTSWGDTFISTPVPAGATTGSVVVTAGGIPSNALSFTVVSPAHITSISPTSGPVSTSITITGTGFGPSGNGSVLFNGNTSVIPSSANWSDTSITVSEPISTAGTLLTIPVVVQTNTQSSAVSSNSAYFTILPTPSVSSVTPTSGPVGTAITVAGSSFGASPGTITLNGAPLTITSWSDTSIAASVPSTASTGKVVVTTLGVSSTNNVNFSVTPVIASITPNSGSINTPVTIAGTGFGLGNSSSVTFKCSSSCTTIGAHPTSWTTNAIVVPIPNLAATGPVTVTVSGVTSNAANITVTADSTGTMSGVVTGAGLPVNGALVEALQGGLQRAFMNSDVNGAYAFSGLVPGSYDVRVTANGFLVTTATGNIVTGGGTLTVNVSVLSPTITGVVPSSGATGSSVVIIGANFGATQGTSTITFNGTPASPSNWGDGSITVSVPAGATTGPVVVREGNVTSNAITFTVGAGTFSGTVSAVASGSPVSGAAVKVLKANQTVASATTASDGTYSIASVGPGTYDLVASSPGLGTQTATAQSATANTSTTVNFALPNAGTIAGTVTKSDGSTPITGAAIAVSQNGISVGSAATDGSGNYSVPDLSSGAATVQVTASGYAPQSQAATVSAGATTTTNFSLSGQSVISYQYDELGRLVGVNDSQNGSAAYTYDAVGNVLSISRATAGQVVLSGFTPRSGPPGTQVTLTGFGFDPTPSQNSVAFNGAAATVMSSTPTRIITTVPAGATSGAITLTTSLGSATSANSFTVTSVAGAPAISGFSPSVVDYGTAVSITGTNFDSSTQANVVKFNTTFAGVSGGNTTSLTASVSAGAASGHISVATSKGTAVSTGDVYVATVPYHATDVAFTGRTSFGQPIHVAIGSANHVGIVIFDGVAGQKASVQLTNGSFLPCSVSNGGTNVSVLNPQGTQIASGFCLQPGTAFVDGVTLHDTGTYTIIIAPQSGGTGSVDVTPVNASGDIRTTIVPNGAPVTVTTTAPGQNAYLTFFGTQNQKVSLQLSNGTYPGCTVTQSGVAVSILKPDGGVLTSNGCAGSGTLLGPALMPETGTYTVFFDPTTYYTGSMTLTLFAFSDINAPIAIDGPPVPVTTTFAGQQAFLPFSGTQNQMVTFQFSNDTYPGCTVTQGGVNIALIAPNGTTAASFFCVGGAGYQTRITLSQTGTYKLNLQPFSNYTGSLTFTIYSVVDKTVPISPGGGPVTVTTDVVGQFVNLPFSANTGQRISLNVTSGLPGCDIHGAGPKVTIFKPDATTLSGPTCYGAGLFVDVLTLASTGTYSIRIDATPFTGSTTLTLYNVPADPTGTVTIGGTAQVVTTTVPGQNASLTFSGTAAQKATVSVSSNTMGSVTVSLISPTGSTVTSKTASTATFNLGSQTLPSTGTYTISINPAGANVGSMSVAVTSP